MKGAFGTMAPSRTRNADSDAPSTADVSASEDVEMQDQEQQGTGYVSPKSWRLISLGRQHFAPYIHLLTP